MTAPLPHFTAKEARRMKWVIGIVMTLAVIGLGWQLFMTVVRNVGPQTHPGLASVQSTGTDIRHLKIGGQDFWIPENLLDVASDTGFLIFALLPDMEGLTEENYHDFMKVGGPESRRVHIHLNFPDGKYDLAHQYKVSRKMSEPFEEPNKKYNLIAESPVKIQPKLWPAELYTDKSSTGEIRGFIECNVDHPDINPGCYHRFAYKNYLLKVSYRKRFLPQWQEIQTKVINLLDSFIVMPSQTLNTQGENP